jgi:two-component system, cell cycle response regulator
VTAPKTLRLLLVEDHPADERFLLEALTEIDETAAWVSWQVSEPVPVVCLREALDCLHRTRFDAVLLNLSLPDSPILLDTFLEVRAAAHDTPILVLMDRPDDHLANRLLREGAQDVLLKTNLECEPLAHAIRHAIERQRRVNSKDSQAFVDALTGLYDLRGFLALGDEYLRLARRTGSKVSVLAMETEHAADRDLALIDASHRLRSTFGESALLGRVSERGFAALVPGQVRLDPAAARVAMVAAGTADGAGIGELLAEAQRRLAVPAAAKAAMLAD